MCYNLYKIIHTYYSNKSNDLLEKSYDEKTPALKLNFFMNKKRGLAESFFQPSPLK